MKTYSWLVRGKIRNLQGEVIPWVRRIMAETAAEAMDAAIGNMPGQPPIAWWVDEPTALNEGEVTDLPQLEPERRVTITSLNPAATRSEQDALMDLAAALAIAGYSPADVAALETALKNNEVHAILMRLDMPLEDGREELWVIEQPDTRPTMHWTLPMWRSRLHSPLCGNCHHHSEDPLMDCPCACHELYEGILNIDL